MTNRNRTLATVATGMSRIAIRLSNTKLGMKSYEEGKEYRIVRAEGIDNIVDDLEEMVVVLLELIEEGEV